MSNFLSTLPDGKVIETICPKCGAVETLADNIGYLCNFCGNIPLQSTKEKIAEKIEALEQEKVTPYDLLKHMDYTELKESEKRLKTALEFVQDFIKEYERKPEHDEEY